MSASYYQPLRLISSFCELRVWLAWPYLWPKLFGSSPGTVPPHCLHRVPQCATPNSPCAISSVLKFELFSVCSIHFLGICMPNSAITIAATTTTTTTTTTTKQWQVKDRVKHASPSTWDLGPTKIYVIMSALTTAIFHHAFKFQIVSTYKVNTSGDTLLHNRLDIHAGMICLIATRPPPTKQKQKQKQY